MIHASGNTTSLLPADGGQIRTDKVEFIQGTIFIDKTKKSNVLIIGIF